ADGDRAERLGEVVVVVGPRELDRADERDRRDGVGQRHQRRVQERAHPLDDLEADEGRQHEDEDGDGEVVGHQPSFPGAAPGTAATGGPPGAGVGRGCGTGSASPSAWRSRAFVTSPPRATRRSRTISSSGSALRTRSLPLYKFMRKAVRFCSSVVLACTWTCSSVLVGG